MSDNFQTYKVGEKIGQDLTILSVVSQVRGRHPVYLGWDHRAWCHVVVKVFRNSRKAQREHDALTAVSHPYIARSLGTYEPAIMLMEHLNGPTLDAYAREQDHGQLDLSNAIRVALHIGGALEHVHRKGYVHLDVKPGNIIIANGRPILFDFGAARRLDQERPPVIQGTDAYMAPEECNLGQVSPASDVFSLGILLFELLAGALPFADATRKVLHPQLTMAPYKLADFRDDVPDELQSLIEACLSLDPACRPALTAMLPRLHCFISEGPRMWPRFFDPEPVPEPDITVPNPDMIAA